MLKILFVWALLSFFFVGNSQTLTVTDKQTGEPVYMATITSDVPKVFVITDLNGKADISGFSGAQIIELRSMGYKTEIMSYSDFEELNFEIGLLVSLSQFDEVIVSASRWSQTAQNVPAKVSIISQNTRLLHNPQTAADLLSLSGEIFIQKSQQGGGSPMIRGFSTNRLLYTVDGIRMNTAIFRAGNIQNVISLDAFSIESTEVLFGPGSVIYGSDAIGGVMSFQTLTPQFAQSDKILVSGNAVSRYASANNEQSYHFHSFIAGKKWASVTSLTSSAFGNLKMGKYGHSGYLKPYYVQRIDSADRVFVNPDPLVQNPTAYNQLNMMQKIRYAPNKKWDLLYGFHYSETSEYARYDRLIEMQTNGLPVSAVWNYGPQIWILNYFSLTHSHKNKLYDNFVLRLAHQYFEESRIDRKLNSYRLRTNLEEVQAYSVNLDFAKSHNKHKISYGAEYVINDVTSKGSAIDIRDNRNLDAPARYPAAVWQSLAAFVNYQYSITSTFLVQTGLRFNAFRTEADFSKQLSFYPFNFANSIIQNTSTTGSLGIVYKPDNTWKISTNLSTGFRAPNVDDLGKIFDFSEGEVVVPNPSLSAEYAYNGELSISKIWGNLFRIDITGFYTYLDKAMVRREFAVAGNDSIVYNGSNAKVYAIQNAANATVYGINAAIELNLASGFRLLSQYNFQKGTEEMDNGAVSPSRHAAPAFGRTQLSYKQNKMMMQLYAIYNAAVYYSNLNEEEKQKPVIYIADADGNPYSPKWYTINFKIMYQFHSNFAVTSGVENITNQRYRPYSSGLVAPGRNFIFSVNANF